MCINCLVRCRGWNCDPFYVVISPIDCKSNDVDCDDCTTASTASSEICGVGAFAAVDVIASSPTEMARPRDDPQIPVG